MNDKNEEQLLRDFPGIFQKSGDISFDVDDGWYHIIHVLMSKLSYDYENAQRRLKYAIEHPNDVKETIPQLEKMVSDAYANMPMVRQVKEKFGGLRFYTTGVLQDQYAFIEFAESMSYHVCEVCGSPGKIRNSGWIKTLCDTHAKESGNDDDCDDYYIANGAVAAAIPSDDL